MVMNQIISGVYLGDASSSKDLASLQKNEISHILVVGARLPQHYPKMFTYHQISIEDHADELLIKHFETCIDFILKGLKKGAVLVHCLAGISRSSSVVIAYLMCQHQFPYEMAFKHTEQSRPWISPSISNIYNDIYQRTKIK